MAMAAEDVVSPFLNVFKDGRLLDSFSLDGRDSFVLGRHTNCDVLLAHPSISRHHLEIQLLRATRELRLTDLDSVHGTWIEGKQVPPLRPTTVKEGEPIKLGASSRIYKIQWLPHPQPTSSNERSSEMSALHSAESDHSSIADTKRCPCSSKTKDNHTGSHEIEQHDLLMLDQNGIPSPRAVQSPRIVQEILVAGQTIGGVETLNANISLQISEPKGNREALPPLPPMRSTPSIPMQQVTTRESASIRKALLMDSHGGDLEPPKGNATRTASSRLWLRRCNSAPSPQLNTTVPIPSSEVMDENRATAASPNRNATTVTSANHQPSGVNQYVTGNTFKEVNKPNASEAAQNLSTGFLGETDELPQENSRHISSLSFDEAGFEDDYASDKENQGPVFCHSKHSARPLSKIQTKASEGASSGPTELSRQPFRPLIPTAKGFRRSASPSRSYGYTGGENSGFAKQERRSSSVVQNLDLMLQKLKGSSQSEPHREWHIVVDASCLLDPKSLKSLKLLEGTKEVRLIVPQIVVRELDLDKKRKDRSSNSQTTVLKWIESCMLKFPTWIHVQSSSENFLTPPASPLHPHAASPNFGGNFGDLMSPTNGDHVLNCALLFSNTVFDGQVALLTNDTALKIKAMAEGLVCESAPMFCESLLNPYSDRFLWCDSTAHGPNWSEKTCQTHYHSRPTSAADDGRYPGLTRKALISAARAIASKKHHAADGLKTHCKQAQGLQVLLR